MEDKDRSLEPLKESFDETATSYGATGQDSQHRKRSSKSEDPDSKNDDDDEPGEITGPGPYTTTKLIQKIGFGKAQIIMVSLLFLCWFSEASEIMIMPILSTR